MKFKPLEYTKFATVAIVVAQLVSGLMSIIVFVMGVYTMTENFFMGLLTVGYSIVLSGVFFALARVQSIEYPNSKEK